MRRVSLDQLLRGTPGCVWSGKDQIGWRPTSGVVGISLARRLTAESLLPLSSIIASLSLEKAPVDAFVLDGARVEPDGCDEAALITFRRFVAEPLAAQTKVRELLVVASQGLSQVAMVGAFTLARPRAWRVLPSLDSALRTQMPAGRPMAWVEELLGVINSELTPLGLVSRVRAELGESPGRSLSDVAKRLAMSPRSVQRALTHSATTFANERVDLRLELAASRLAKTTEKIQLIAAEVGYRSLAHFNMVFKARYGLTPLAFRARRQQPSPVR